jgi:hypothetical protein
MASSDEADSWKILNSHGSEDVDCGHLGCDAMSSCWWLPVF